MPFSVIDDTPPVKVGRGHKRNDPSEAAGTTGTRCFTGNDSPELIERDQPPLTHHSQASSDWPLYWHPTLQPASAARAAGPRGASPSPRTARHHPPAPRSRRNG